VKTQKLKKKAAQEARKLHGKLLGDRGKLVLLCSKCDAGKKSEELGNWLSKKIESAGHSGVEIRTSGCLGPCPDDQLVAAMGGKSSGEWKSCWALDPREERRKLLERILAQLGS
jgi:hypothetical protein